MPWIHRKTLRDLREYRRAWRDSRIHLEAQYDQLDAVNKQIAQAHRAWGAVRDAVDALVEATAILDEALGHPPPKSMRQQHGGLHYGDGTRV